MISPLVLRAPRKIAGRGGVDPFAFCPPVIPAQRKRKPVKVAQHRLRLDLDRVQRLVL